MQRTDMVNQAFLLWLRANNDRQPNPDDILTLGTVAPGGVELGADELETCVEYLAALGLIQGQSVMQRKMLLRVRLTDSGIRCVAEYNGDVARWLQSQQPRHDQTVNIHAGRDAQVAAHSSNVTQAQNRSSVDVEKLVESASSVRGLQGQLESDSSVDYNEVVSTVNDIEVAAQQQDPDHSKLRSLGSRLVQLLAPAAAGAALVRYVVEATTAAIS